MKTRVPSIRQPELDIARGIAIICMIWVHVLELFSLANVRHSPFGIIIEFLGSPPAAPVFMVLLGISLAFSRESTPKNLIKRGIELIVYGYLLNIMGGILPRLVEIAIHGDDIHNLFAFLYIAKTVDILHLAGCSLMILGVFKQLHFSNLHYLLCAVFISLISPFLWGLNTNIEAIDFILDLLWGNQHYVYFPVFSWSVYPIIGVILGDHLTRSRDKSIFYNTFAILGCFCILFGSLSLLFMMNLINPNDWYWRQVFAFNSLILGFVMGWLSLFHYIYSKKWVPQSLMTLFRFWSENVTKIYFIQWLLIDWMVLCIPPNSQSFIGVILLMIGIPFLSDFLIRQLNRVHKKNIALSRSSAYFESNMWKIPNFARNNQEIKQLILFDIDGTLILSGKVHSQAFISAIKSVFNITNKLDFSYYYGWTDPWILRDILQKNDIPEAQIEAKLPEIMKKMEQYYELHTNEEEGFMFPGVIEFLTELQKRHILCGLVTGNLEKIAFYKLSHYNLASYFALGGFGSDHWDRSQLLLAAIKKAETQFNFKYNNHNVVYIADSPNDVKAANAAKLPVVIVQNKMDRNYDFTGLTPNKFLPSFHEMEQFFDFFTKL